MTKKEYYAAAGARISDTDAAIIGAELEKLTKGRREATDAEIVHTARSETSPLHRFFVWDKDEAHEMLLLQQAQYLARNVVVKVVVDEREEEIRAFHRIHVHVGEQDTSEGQGSIIVSLDTVKKNPDYVAERMRDAKAHLIGWNRTWKVYKAVFAEQTEAFEPVFEAIGALEEQPVEV